MSALWGWRVGSKIFPFKVFNFSGRRTCILAIFMRGSPGEYSDVDIYSGYCAAHSILDKSGRISQNPRHVALTNKL